MAYALGLPAALACWGLQVEVVPGWETRSAGSFNPVGALCHWTAGPRGSTSRPSLSIVTNGRPDLPGPLCNVYLARNGVAIVVAAGRANHGGAGVWHGATGNSAFFGTEAEAADNSDFTAAQRWAYPRVNAAYMDLGVTGVGMIAGHSEYATPPGRKQDINGYTMDDMRLQVAALRASGPTGGDDMAAVPQTQWDEAFMALKQIRDVLGAQGGENTTPDVSLMGDTGKAPGLFRAWLAPIERYDLDANGKPKVGPDGQPMILKTSLRQELANLSLAVAGLHGTSTPTSLLGSLSDADVARLAEAVADEQDRRARDSDPNTGPTS
jgi:hypothetical protein